jgi:DNA-binding PadR family transcriptional regulator
MIHSFDIEIAQAYGVNAAIILNNMYFWVEKNRANETNFHDGRYWTYNSVKAFSKLFPYLTPRAISTALKKLIDDGLVITGNYNKSSYDRTLWYAITEKGYSILQKCKMEETKVNNGSAGNVQPIPDIKPVPKPIPKQDNKRKKEETYDSIVSEYTSNEDLRAAIIDFIKMRKLIKSPLTDRALKTILSKLDTLESTDERKIRVLEQSIANSWKGVFPLKDDRQDKRKVSGETDYGSPLDFYK